MDHPKEITLTASNVVNFPKFMELFDAGKIVADKTGRLRYQHGAPVGRLILIRVTRDGVPLYKESASEWFDPESPMALAFKWPE